MFASFVGGGLPIGMLTLAVLLLVRLQSGSLLGAGIMAAALTAGNAVGVAVQGAMIDRLGQARVLVPASLTCLLSLVGMVLAVGRQAPPLLSAALSLLGGAAIPATPSSMRVLWTVLVAEPEQRLTAYALSAVSFTGATIIGPLVVSGLLLAGGPQLAVLVAASLAGGGGLFFALTPTSRRWAPAVPVGPRPPRGWRGPGMRTLVVGNAGLGLAAGLVGVALPAAAIVLGAAALAGVFSAAGAFGDFCGGFIYGSRAWRAPLPSRLVAAQCGSAGTGVCLALASGTIVGMAVVMPLSGAAGAVQGVTATTLLDDVAEPGALTGSYAMLVGGGLVGSALGYLAGGLLVPATGVRAVFFISSAIGLAVAAWYARRVRTFKSSS